MTVDNLKNGIRERACLLRLALTAAAFLLLAASAAVCPAQLIVAHRGASHDAPENTLAAFRLAWEQGADAIEGDFYLTRDGQIVCLHDETTGRTADADLNVAGSTLAELRRLDVGRWKDPRFAGERIPTLSEVLDTVPPGRGIFIEIKCGPEIVPALQRDMEASGLDPQQMVVISFQEAVIAAVKEAMPDIQALWLTGYRKDERTGHDTPTIETILETLERMGADGLDTQAHATVDETFVRRLREAGYEFHCWTVNDPEVARRFQALGVDSITTDRPGFLREQLRRPPARRARTSSARL